jgi:methionyl-tRNA formyltransferase
MKIVFAGTPEFAAIILGSLLKSNHSIVGVMTQPDRPSGRGLKLQASHVKALALENNIPVLQPTSLRLDGKYGEQALAAKEQLADLDFDVMVVAAYGLILPIWLLDFVQTKNPLGCINVHASLLPRWRGAAPIHRAIWSGDEITGTTIMKMAQGLDTGPVISSETMLIQSLDTTGTLHDRLASQGARVLLEVLDQIALGKDLQMVNQPEEGVTYAEKIRKEEAKINWAMDALLIDRQIRALNPSPGANTLSGTDIIKVWLSENISHVWPSEKRYSPGQIIEINDLGICVACKTGVVRLLELQKAGGKRLSANLFAKSMNLAIGNYFE